MAMGHFKSSSKLMGNVHAKQANHPNINTKSNKNFMIDAESGENMAKSSL